MVNSTRLMANWPIGCMSPGVAAFIELAVTASRKPAKKKH